MQTSCSSSYDVNASLKLRRERFDDADVVGSKLGQLVRLVRLRSRKLKRVRGLEQRRSHMTKQQAQ